MKYKVRYYFDGSGEATIEAKTEKEARDKFYNGYWESDEEGGDTYEVDTIEKI